MVTMTDVEIRRYSKTDTPWEHQAREFLRSCDAEYWMYNNEQRTGKSLLSLMRSAYLFEQGLIDALVISAPSGVHINWAREEIPRHLVEWTKPKVYLWRSGTAGSKRATEEREALLSHAGLSIFIVNVEALITERVRDYLTRFFKARKRVHTQWDESSDIASPGAKRTKVSWAIGRRSFFRTTLDGTPATESPLEFYGQVGALTPSPFGFKSFFAFKHHYAEWEKGYNSNTDSEYETLKNYQNLEELQAKLSSFSSRVLRRDCRDMPEKLYLKRFVTMSDEQRRVYKDLRDEFLAELSKEKRVTATHVLTRALRLQQVLSGFTMPDREALPCASCAGEGLSSIGIECETCEGLGFVEDTSEREIHVIPGPNPRLDAFLEEVKKLRGAQYVCWVRFRYDGDVIQAALSAAGLTSVRFDGSVDSDQRELNKAAFREGRAQGFIATPAAASRGQMLANASVSIFYSNGQSLRKRLQAEDRTESLSKATGNSVLDIVAEGTVDEKLVQAFRDKKSLADRIMQDGPSNFL